VLPLTPREPTGGPPPEILRPPSAIVSNGITFQRARVGRRRLLADGTPDTATPEGYSAELHTHGAGIFGLKVRDMNERYRPWTDQQLPQQPSDQSIAVATLSGLYTLPSTPGTGRRRVTMPLFAHSSFPLLTARL
jgi:hypothetical protein